MPIANSPGLRRGRSPNTYLKDDMNSLASMSTTHSVKRRYIGTKTIDAIPMTRLAYNLLRGWTLPADENGEDAGYLVEYLDGGQANVKGFTGYISWSPAEVFEKSYKVADTYQDRVRLEQSDLVEKIEKLAAFFVTDRFESLPPGERDSMHAQHAAMCDYSNALSERIAAFEP